VTTPFQTLADGQDLLRARNVEHEQIVSRGGRTWSAAAVLRELQLIGSTRKSKNHAVVAVMIFKPIEFAQA
jgi:hypothetical protein